MAGVAAPLLYSAAKHAPHFATESYIWIQYAERNHKTLGECLDEVIPMARAAGFENVEMNQDFFTPELRDRSRTILVSNRLRVSSVYVSGAMHTRELAEATIKNAIEIAEFSKPLGCHALVTDPIPKPQRARKSDAELAVQTASLNRLGRELSSRDVQLWVHNHDAEMVENAREWRRNLTGTDPKYVWMCIDLDWVHQG
ncbi:MAG: sugar phosphate isomerase/epimerase family protein, partial [Bryobacteraceae bacterium]